MQEQKPEVKTEKKAETLAIKKKGTKIEAKTESEAKTGTKIEGSRKTEVKEEKFTGGEASSNRKKYANNKLEVSK